ncbi:hypothetical protein EZ449_13715 [Pedobacter frigidisoli]|uniref:Glycosyl transferase family 28 C-terminal domain-containing protein n=1 Tax=Pedobacter frigidisoli TaxID=2530455 RepID=A0A4R0P595_9SPHI|nr:hypothetical protein [Pedobacter frigidisoli]TCD07593.1 hypothetical protein EZ449_13715 [Pedobacter frigidisoli]
MSFTIAFYVHHHGSGHLIRTLKIATQLTEYSVILLGSELNNTVHPLPENVTLIHLPPDFTDQELPIGNTPDTFHYAPIGLSGIRERMSIMADLFRRISPLILVVDVSVEVALFARLCSVPTVVIRQHGIRDDLPHLMAYQSAALIIAPFARAEHLGSEDWIYSKTVFTGGFSRFDHILDQSSEVRGQVGVLIGSGGSSINAELIESIAEKLPNHIFHVLGLDRNEISNPNVYWHGRLLSPESILRSCQFIIGNTGHNTVMEVASLNKRFLGIPEIRPFDEQLEKARAIQEREGIKIIGLADLADQDWPVIFQELESETPDWQGVTDAEGAYRMAKAIIDTAGELFNP